MMALSAYVARRISIIKCRNSLQRNRNRVHYLAVIITQFTEEHRQRCAALPESYTFIQSSIVTGGFSSV